MKSRSKIKSRNADVPSSSGAGKPPLTLEHFKKWQGVFEPEFWDEVRKARDCGCPSVSEKRK